MVIKLGDDEMFLFHEAHPCPPTYYLLYPALALP